MKWTKEMGCQMNHALNIIGYNVKEKVKKRRRIEVHAMLHEGRKL